MSSMPLSESEIDDFSTQALARILDEGAYRLNALNSLLVFTERLAERVLSLEARCVDLENRLTRIEGASR